MPASAPDTHQGPESPLRNSGEGVGRDPHVGDPLAGLALEALLTAAHRALLPGASQLVPVFVHTPALASAAVALRCLVVALLVAARNESPCGNRRAELTAQQGDAQGTPAWGPQRERRGPAGAHSS